MTGYPELESAIQAIRLGARDYLLKPFDLELLRHRVNQALERYRLLAEREALLATLEQAVRLLRKGFEAE